MAFFIRRGFSPRTGIPGILSWWDTSTAPQLLGANSQANSWSTVVDQVSGNHLVAVGGWWSWLTGTTAAGRTYALQNTNGGICGMTLTRSIASIGLTGATLFVAGVKGGNNDNQAFYDGWGNSALTNTYHAFSDTNVYDTFGTNSRKSYANTGNFSGAHVIATRSTNGQWNSWLDGVQMFSTTTNTFSVSAAAPNNAIISNHNGVSYSWYEAIFVGGYVPDPLLLQVTRYLGNKWGIAVR